MENEAREKRDARIEALWRSLDVKGAGHLELDDLRHGLQRINHPLKDADNLIKDVLYAIDENHDGRIQYHEFRNFVTHAESQLWLLFKTIDRDHNERLSKAELRDAYREAGISLPQEKLDDFFHKIDRNHDGVISFDEWRDFLLFIPADVPGLKTILSYSTSVRVNAEGDVHLSDEATEGLGTKPQTPSRFSLRGVFAVFAPPRIRHRPPDQESPAPVLQSDEGHINEAESAAKVSASQDQAGPDVNPSALDPFDVQSPQSLLSALMPEPRYFLCGAVAGIVSRTSTAPLDRLKVYLIAQTTPVSKAVQAAKKGSPIEAAKHSARPLVDACKALWRAGGVRSLFAGNGLNVAKVMPESAIKFGSYEASKRLLASIEGHGDPSEIHPSSQFIAGGLGGMFAQFCVYPVDTLKFRMQCDVVEGGLQGNALIKATAKKMWARNGPVTFYRGLPMGLVGMFPYSAIDLGTFEFLKRMIINRNMKIHGCEHDAAMPGSVATAIIGGFSGALGASAVYPLNLLRTRLQAQGSSQHPQTYTGIVDVTRQTIKGEGVRGLFKGLTPNLLKVVPAVSITYVVYENSKKALHLA